MYSIITGSLIISLLHAVIPNHWLPIIAIGRKERWPVSEVLKVTFICAVAHGISTILIGVFLGLLGAGLSDNIHFFTRLVAPVILILIGILFIYRHHKHKHFHLNGGIQKKQSKKAIIFALFMAMFLSPCMEIEAYFLLAGMYAWWLVWLIAAMYFVITTTGMMLLVWLAYKGLLKLNWHSLEHNAGIITGVVLIVTGVISFFIS